MKVGQIKRREELLRRKSGNKKLITYDLCIGHKPVDPVLQRLMGGTQTVVNSILTFKTREEAEQYSKQNLKQ